MQDNTLYISKLNENYIRVDSEAGILYELNEYFTFLVPGHTFMPAFRMKTWDGKIRLFSLYEKKIYLGLLKKVLDFASTMTRLQVKLRMNSFFKIEFFM